MRRGDVYLVDLNPAQGSEADKVRPVVIVSGNAANAAASRLGRGVITVVPVTSNVASVLPFQVLLRADECGLAVDFKAQAEQVRALDVARLRKHLGGVPPATMDALDRALRLHLGL